MALTRLRAKLLNHQGDPFCSSAANELRKLGSHLADKLILFDKQLKSICKQEQIGACIFFSPLTWPCILCAWVLGGFLWKLSEVYRNEGLAFLQVCYFCCVSHLERGADLTHSTHSRINWCCVVDMFFKVYLF